MPKPYMETGKLTRSIKLREIIVRNILHFHPDTYQKQAIGNINVASQNFNACFNVLLGAPKISLVTECVLSRFGF